MNATMRIQKLTLNEVACFQHAEIEFQPGRDPDKADIHILVGSNGTGKSTALMALAQVFSPIPVGLVKRFRGRQSAAFVEFDSDLECGLVSHNSRQPAQPIRRGSHTLSQQWARDGLAFMIDSSVEDAQPLVDFRELVRRYQPSEPLFKETQFSLTAFAFSGQRSMASYQLAAIQELQNNPLDQALSFSTGGNPAQLVQWIANSKAKEAFALAKHDNARADRYREAVTRIEQVIADITGKSFHFNMSDDPLKVAALIDDVEVELDVLPDGLKSIISWVADLLMRMDRIPWVDDIPVLERPFFLFLDEIEVHLHPAWQRKVLPTVQGLFPNAQVFISTHSPFIIASADDAWIYPLYEVEPGQGTVVGTPLSSMVGNSYSTVLREALGIDEEFAPQVEEQLDVFYELRDAVLAGTEQIEALQHKGDELRRLGEEVAAIVIPELRQVERRLAEPCEGGAA